jgi:hypothetical protein|tara:strand:- start:6355 stop:6567 length:213 start_codon:yes stop_codon:yes gene_type:complete
MKTYQKRIFESFNKLTEELNHKELEKEVFNSLLETVIDLAVKEDRNESIDSNIKAQSNNFIDSLNNSKEQ